MHDLANLFGRCVHGSPLSCHTVRDIRVLFRGVYCTVNALCHDGIYYMGLVIHNYNMAKLRKFFISRLGAITLTSLAVATQLSQML